jgi:acyl dehydratase
MTAWDPSVVGRWSRTRTFDVTAERVRAYAEAIGDETGALSPVFAVVPGMDLVFDVARAACDEASRAFVVHGQQDIIHYRPLPVDGTVLVRAAVIGLHGKGSGTAATIKVVTLDADEVPLNELYVTEFYRGIGSDLALGEGAPALPRQPPEETPSRVDTVALPIDLPRRYADASGDHNPIHLDEGFARAAGLPGVIVHGLASLAIAARSVIAAAGIGPTGVRRLSCRFTRPITPGDSLTTSVFSSDGTLRFESTDGQGQTVLGAGVLTM